VERRILTASVLFVVCVACGASLPAEERPAVGVWSFEGSLSDRSGRGNDAFATSASFAPGHSGQGLQCGQGAAVVPDSPQLRPAPGLRIECWAKLDRLGPSFQPIVIKDRAYQLRVDPPAEGGQFSFFLHLDGWEPRVRSQQPAKIGAWYHLAAGWDGKEIWLEVNGQRSRVRRGGVPTPSREPLELGRFEGVLDEVRIENPAPPPAGVAEWRFDGNLRDASGHGHDLAGKGARFVPTPGGQALASDSRALQAASKPDLQLAPGLRIDCSVYFDEVPAAGRYIAMKNGEYQLRLNSAKEGGCFALFVNLDGWEPRVCSEQRVEPGRWYRVTASWDGFLLTLDVNGQRSHATRSGLPRVTDNPLVIGALGGRIDNLRIENPRLPTIQVRDARQEHAILLVGRRENFTTTIRNVGTATEQAVVRFKLPPGARLLGKAIHELGTLPTGAERTLEWSVEADAAVLGAADIQVTAAGIPPLTARHPLVFFPIEGGLPPSASEKLPAGMPTGSNATTYYVDSEAGDNSRAGTSPETAWKDFANVNGRVLGPGQRLLLRRGSTFREELQVSAHGTADCWAEIGTYGDGPRPIIRRDWDIDQRCAWVRNPDYLRIRGLVVCYAGKGLIVDYTQPGHRGLVVEDCIAHHIEGLYRFNAHGIPEWRDRRGPTGDMAHNSAGIALAGMPASDLVLRDCEMFQCSSGYSVRGDDVVVDRVYCHDNYVHNTSPHPFVASVRRTLVQNSIFDASGWHASAGTMGVMLGDPQGLIIRNCYFRNQPDSGSHDEGGVDFENRGNGCLIEHCTFENNAGAAIEVLGLKAPQTTNIEIRNSRFIRNNTAHKLGPAEVFVWGRARDPSVCCSTGVVQGNGYVLLPGVEFFTNEAPQYTSWTARNNTPYASVAEIDRGMPFNRPPVVDAGPDLRSDRPKVSLAGRVHDDGRTAGKRLSTTWEVLEGPGRVTFDNAHATATAATFERPGDYLLRLVAHDGELWVSDMAVVHILRPGTSVKTAWEFNTNLDKEGWTEVDPGTRVREWTDQAWPTSSHPVKLVGGGYYMLAIEDSPDAHLLSADHLGIELTGKETFTLRFQNHTPATEMRVRFTTEADPTWDDAKSQAFPVVANDNEARVYTVKLCAAPAWNGRLRQLRVDLATGKPLTGTCRFDYLWVALPARGQ
jgi:hypothetical protein